MRGKDGPDSRFQGLQTKAGCRVSVPSCKSKPRFCRTEASQGSMLFTKQVNSQRELQARLLPSLAQLVPFNCLLFCLMPKAQVSLLPNGFIITQVSVLAAFYQPVNPDPAKTLLQESTLITAVQLGKHSICSLKLSSTLSFFHALLVQETPVEKGLWPLHPFFQMSSPAMAGKYSHFSMLPSRACFSAQLLRWVFHLCRDWFLQFLQGGGHACWLPHDSSQSPECWYHSLWSQFQRLEYMADVLLSPTPLFSWNVQSWSW